MLVVAIAFAGTADAQQVNREVTGSGLPSAARDLDFWLGRWDLVVSGNAPATNFISPFGLGGIAVLEDYRQGAYLGTSVSYYSPREGQWRQLWLDNNPGLLEFAGGKQGNKFLISGHVGTTRTRLVYSNITTRSIDQSYDVSADGIDWQVNFAAKYTRQPGTNASDAPIPANGKRGGAVESILPLASRQFDFWLGSWTVIGDDAFAGAGTVSTYGLGGGIAVLQNLDSNDGDTASSVAVYHPQDRIWNYVSIDSDGQQIDVSGGLQSGRMVLEGIVTGPDEAPGTRARLTFDRPSEREVTQTLEVSIDEGQTWNVRRIRRYARGTIDAPENLRATKTKKKKVTLAWDDVTTTETKFELLRRDGDDWTVIATLDPNATGSVVKGLARRTEYRFGVRGCDAFGCSEPSEVVVTTK